jgi:hypothetical protein
MFYLYVDLEDVLSEYPLVANWLDSAEDIVGTPIEDDKLEVYYSYGYFHPKVEDKHQYYEDLFNRCSTMEFEERLEHELSKIRVNLTLKRNHFFISNRLEKGFIPMFIQSIVSELTKIKMLIEYEFHQNKKIMESIPEIDKSIVSVEFIKEAVEGDVYTNQDYDIDDILDKISNGGLDSLSEEEKDFLDKKSKDI